MAPIQSRNTRCDSLSELFLKACKNGEVAKVNAAIVLDVDVNFEISRMRIGRKVA